MFTTKYVVMQDVIGDLASEYGVPVLPFDSLVELGRKAVVVYNLEDQGRYITFDTMCVYIKKYISTPFGKKFLTELMQ